MRHTAVMGAVDSGSPDQAQKITVNSATGTVEYSRDITYWTTAYFVDQLQLPMLHQVW